MESVKFKEEHDLDVSVKNGSIHLQDSSHSKLLLAELTRQFQTGQYGDVEFVPCNHEPILAHSCVLAAQSERMRDLIELHSDSGLSLKMPFEHRDLYCLITFMYTGSLDIPTEDIKRVRDIAKYFKIPLLVQELKNLRKRLKSGELSSGLNHVKKESQLDQKHQTEAESSQNRSFGPPTLTPQKEIQLNQNLQGELPPPTLTPQKSSPPKPCAQHVEGPQYQNPKGKVSSKMEQNRSKMSLGKNKRLKTLNGAPSGPTQTAPLQDLQAKRAKENVKRKEESPVKRAIKDCVSSGRKRKVTSKKTGTTNKQSSQERKRKFQHDPPNSLEKKRQKIAPGSDDEKLKFVGKTILHQWTSNNGQSCNRYMKGLVRKVMPPRKDGDMDAVYEILYDGCDGVPTTTPLMEQYLWGNVSSSTSRDLIANTATHPTVQQIPNSAWLRWSRIRLLWTALNMWSLL